MFGRVIWIQILVTIVGAGLGSTLDLVTGYCALLGGLVATSVNAYFAHRVFAARAGESATRLVATMYRAEIVKLVLAGALFAGLFATVPTLNVAALFLSFGVVYVGAGLALLGAGPIAGAAPAHTDT